MIIRKKSANEYGVYHDGTDIGTVVLSHNPYHNTNCYVKLDLNCFDPQLSKELFAKLKEIADCPLQVMTESDDAALTAFLVAGGFTCKRKCYEVETGISDYIASIKNTPPCRTIAGEPEYEQACRQMFEHYVATHETINPWTSDYETFRKELPETVLYAERSSEITACAFVEDNEIAYVCGKDIGHFKEFAQCLVTFILSQYETVCFESDDCDWAAMTLRSLFQNLDESSYDTYVCDNKRGNPCGCASIPYWKAKSIVVPEGMMIVHSSAYQKEAYSSYVDEPYFRLYHDLRNLTESSLPAGFSIHKAVLSDFAAHINRCYTGIGITEAELCSYTERTVFNETLWLAVQDDQTGKIVATSIGELDAEVGEGVLEWIQVSKEYRGQGLGSYLVSELLWRMKDLADFATVSGQCNNPSHPESLYRKCGFTGNDVWHILRKT